MRFSHALVCGFSLPLLAVSLFAQSSSPAAAPASQSTPAQPANPAPALQLRDLPSDPHTPTPEEEAQQKAEQIRLALIRLASGQASWGPETSASGMSLDLKEVKREQTPNGTQITWQLTGKGFTPDMQLTLIRWPLNENVTPVMSGIVVNASGTAVCGTPSSTTPASPTTSTANALQAPACTATIKPGTPIEISSTAAKGEAIRVALIAADRTHGAAVSLVPFPIVGEDRGCRLEVLLGLKNAGMVLIEGEGFKQDATYTIGSESYGEKHPLETKINAQGKFVAALTPGAQGHDTGDTVIYYQSGTCTPTVSFHWGKGSYKPE